MVVQQITLISNFFINYTFPISNVARTGMPLQGYGDSAHPPEVARPNAKAVDFAGEPNAFASRRLEIVFRPPQRYVRP